LKNVKTIENEYEISCLSYEIKDDNHNESMEIETMDIVKLMPKMITQILQSTFLEIYIRGDIMGFFCVKFWPLGDQKKGLANPTKGFLKIVF
jgi:hypothetical protein